MMRDRSLNATHFATRDWRLGAFCAASYRRLFAATSFSISRNSHSQHRCMDRTLCALSVPFPRPRFVCLVPLFHSNLEIPMKQIACLLCSALFLFCAALLAFADAPRRPLASRLDAAALNRLLAGACLSGCSGVTNCNPNPGPGQQGSSCSLGGPTCQLYSGTCASVQLVNGPACGELAGYQNCQLTVTGNGCAIIRTGTPDDNGDCTCPTPMGNCGSLQTTCTATKCD